MTVGPDSAESQWRVDFTITAKLSNAWTEPMEKAVLGQAKRGYIFGLPNKERKRLVGQCKKMKSSTDHYVVLEVPEDTRSGPTILQSIDGDIKLDEELNVWPSTRWT